MKDLFLLRPDITFLNHGSFGACPRPVFDRYQTWQRELETQPVEFLGRRFPILMQEARAALAAYVHVAPNDLVFVPNATTGINIVARSLDLHAGDEVLSTDHEYGAMTRTWRFICQQRGATLVNQPIPLPVTDPAAAVETLWAAVTPRTRVLFISHITSPTALTLPVAALCQRARAAGILTVVDGAHSLGQLDLDLAALGADFVSGNCHKWLCAPKGAGYLYARPAVQDLVQPLVVSWGWQSDAPGPSRFVDYLEWQGTDDVSAYLTVPAAIEFQRAHDWPQVRTRCHALVRLVRHMMGDLTGLPPICPEDRTWFTQMATLRLPPCNTAQLQSHLWNEERIEVPVITWNGEPFIRVSIQGYNTEEDVLKLLAALARWLPRVGV